MGEQLSQQQRMVIILVLEELGDVFCNESGTKNLIEHDHISDSTQPF